jgi:hypothetical protein
MLRLKLKLKLERMQLVELISLTNIEILKIMWVMMAKIIIQEAMLTNSLIFWKVKDMILNSWQLGEKT